MQIHSFNRKDPGGPLCVSGPPGYFASIGFTISQPSEPFSIRFQAAGSFGWRYFPFPVK